MGVGLSLGLFLPGLIAEHWGWHTVFPAIALPTMGIGIAMLLRVHEPTTARATERRPRRSVRDSFARADLWALYVAGAALVYTLYCVVTWSPAMVYDGRHYAIIPYDTPRSGPDVSLCRRRLARRR